MLASDTYSVRWWQAVCERRRQRKVLLWWPLAAIGVLMAVAALADQSIMEALRHWPAYERAFFAVITDFGKSDWNLIPTLVAWIVCALLARLNLTYSWAWANRAVMNISAYVFTSVAIAGLVTVVLKRLIGRARPMYLEELGPLYFKPFDLLDWSFHSFPSGHGTTIVAFAFALRTFTNRRFHGWIIGFGVAVAISRVVVGDHFLTDVVAGTFVGLAVAIIVRDVFVTRNWGMRMENGKVRYRMFSAFKPMWRWIRRGHVPKMLK